MNKLIAGGLAAGFALTAAAQHAAHEHGVAELEVAADGSTVLVALRGPVDNFVGFEHAPRSQAERAALDRALTLLRHPDRVVALPAAAGCRPEAVEVADPFAASREEDEGPGSDGHGRADHRNEDAGHADLTASYRFHCARPAALSGVEVKLFDAFPRLARLRAVSVGPGGQHAADLRRDRTALPL